MADRIMFGLIVTVALPLCVFLALVLIRLAYETGRGFIW